MLTQYQQRKETAATPHATNQRSPKLETHTHVCRPRLQQSGGQYFWVQAHTPHPPHRHHPPNPPQGPSGTDMPPRESRHVCHPPVIQQNDPPDHHRQRFPQQKALGNCHPLCHDIVRLQEDPPPLPRKSQGRIDKELKQLTATTPLPPKISHSSTTNRNDT